MIDFPEPPDDVAARHRAELDQVYAANAEGVTGFANTLCLLHTKLQDGGFRPDEAFDLVSDFANALFAQTFVAQSLDED